MNILDLIQRKLRTKGFGVQSPFAYSFLTEVVHKARSREEFEELTAAFATRHNAQYVIVNKPQELPPCADNALSQSLTNPFTTTFDLKNIGVGFVQLHAYHTQHIRAYIRTLPSR